MNLLNELKNATINEREIQVCIISDNVDISVYCEIAEMDMDISDGISLRLSNDSYLTLYWDAEPVKNNDGGWEFSSGENKVTINII